MFISFDAIFVVVFVYIDVTFQSTKTAKFE